MGGGGLGWKNGTPEPPGPPPGVCNSLQPARAPALGGARSRNGAPKRVLSFREGDFECPRMQFLVSFSTLKGQLLAHFRISRSFERATFDFRRTIFSPRESGQPSDQAELCDKTFLRGRRQWASAHLVSADPARRVGPWRKRAPGTRGRVEELFSRAWGEVG